MKGLIVFLLITPCLLAEGGMAELKSITGDAPYQGPGNAPAVLPQPMGFWGRPRYYPAGGMGGGQMMPSQYGPGGWYSGMGGPFSSVSGGPYAIRGMAGSFPTDSLSSSSYTGRRFSPVNNDNSMEQMDKENLMLGALTVLGSLMNGNSDATVAAGRAQMAANAGGGPGGFGGGSSGFGGDSSGGFDQSMGGSPSSAFASPSMSGSPAAALSSATGGGFYKGKGNGK